jgi:hypothetical protein
MWPFLNNVTTTCGCTHCTPSTSICYTGVNLSCIGVNKNDTLSVALQKINALMCTPITNTEIITALGYTPSNDDDVVHKTGNETIDGAKTFNNSQIFIKNAGNTTIGSIYKSGNGWRFLNSSTLNSFSVEEGILFLFKTTISIYSRIDTSFLTAIRTHNLPDASGTIALVETIKPYKVYTALLSQSGTSAPTAIVLENTLGTITFTYTGIGQYQINSAGLFTLDKTLLFIQGSSDGDINSAYILDKLYYNTSSIINCITSGVTNGMLNKTSIEIRVYN